MKHIDKFTALNLEEYKGEWSIIQGYSKDGDFKPSWVTEEWGKEKTPKTMPKRVKLGDNAKAIEAILWMYRELTGQDLKADDAPF